MVDLEGSLTITLIADFEAVPLTGNAPLEVQFTDLSIGNPTIGQWDFDNDLIIDDMTEGDIGEVFEIEKASFPDPWSVDLFKAELQSPHSFNLVVRDNSLSDKSVAAYIVYWIAADEMQILETALARAEAGTPQIVGIVADAGVGKSRLCAEFLERCRARRIMTYEATGVSHGKSVPLLPILSLFRRRSSQSLRRLQSCPCPLQR